MLEGWKGTHRPVIIQTIKSFIGATPDKKKLNLKNLNKKVRRGPTSGRHFKPKKVFKNKRQIQTSLAKGDERGNHSSSTQSFNLFSNAKITEVVDFTNKLQHIDIEFNPAVTMKNMRQPKKYIH